MGIFPSVQNYVDSTGDQKVRPSLALKLVREAVRMNYIKLQILGHTVRAFCLVRRLPS